MRTYSLVPELNKSVLLPNKPKRVLLELGRDGLGTVFACSVAPNSGKNKMIIIGIISSLTPPLFLCLWTDDIRWPPVTGREGIYPWQSPQAPGNERFYRQLPQIVHRDRTINQDLVECLGFHRHSCDMLSILKAENSHESSPAGGEYKY